MSPELLIERRRVQLHWPTTVRQRLRAGDPVKNDAQVPIAKTIAEEEEVASSKSGRERCRDQTRELGYASGSRCSGLGDDEAVVVALGG